MTKKKRRQQPVIYHTSAATIDRDQAQALRAARKIFGNSGPEPLPSPIRRPNRRKKN